MLAGLVERVTYHNEENSFCVLRIRAPATATALDLELTEGSVIADSVGETPCVFLAGLHRAERVIADRVMRLADGTLLPWPWIDPDKALPWVEERIGLALAGSQVGAIRLALISNVLVMTGGPGETSIVKANFAHSRSEGGEASHDSGRI